MSDSGKSLKEQIQGGKNWWSVNRIFWGLLLIVVGGLILASNFGWASVQWANLWSLWPLTIVAAGLSLISLPIKAWRAVTIVLAIALVGLVAFAALDEGFGARVSNDYSVSSGVPGEEVNKAKVSIKAGGGEIDIDSENQNETLTASLSSNVAQLADNYSVEDSTQIIDLSMEADSNWWVGNIDSKLQVNLTRNLPIDLSIDFGAADADIDLSKVHLTGLSIKTGASSTKIKLGDKGDEVSVKIETGASSITVYIPEDSGVKATVSQGLASVDLADLTETSEGAYESSNYESAKKVINLDIKIGAASFAVERY